MRYFFIIILCFIVSPRLYAHIDGPIREGCLVEYVKTLPETSFFAGHPREMNGIGIFAKRRIFLTRKMSTEVYWKTYLALMTERTQDFFKAYYAGSGDDVSAFAQKYGVTHIVLYERHFLKRYLDFQDYYDDPFNEFVCDYVNGRSNFYLKEKIDRYKEKKNAIDNIFVFDCRKMEIIYGCSMQEPSESVNEFTKKILEFHRGD